MSGDEYLASLMPYWGDMNGDGEVTQEEFNNYFTCFAAHVSDNDIPLVDAVKMVFNKDF